MEIQLECKYCHVFSNRMSVALTLKVIPIFLYCVRIWPLVVLNFTWDVFHKGLFNLHNSEVYQLPIY